MYSRAATSIAAGFRARCWWRWRRAAARRIREVLTHGFLIDLEGRKMSKSVGNAIAPQDVIKESGAEIFRCGWR
jgi:leucyl-tRNA synthetase